MHTNWVVPRKLFPCAGNVKYSVRFQTVKPHMPSVPINVCLIEDADKAMLCCLSWNNLKTDDDINYEIMGPDIDVRHIMIAAEDTEITRAVIHKTVAGVVADKEDGGYEIVPESEKEYMFVSDERASVEQGNTLYLTAVDEEQTNRLKALKPLFDAEYLIIKERILTYAAELTLAGSLLTAGASSIERGYAFAFGGSLGYIYVKLLEDSIDRVGDKAEWMAVSLDRFVRLGIVFALAGGVLMKHKTEIIEDPAVFMAGFLGFMTYRLAMFIAYLQQNNEDKEDKHDTM